ncbi:hypothetical protein B0G73_110185 [Paraburkholderia sp. BL25I1N1]|nr:hypothetical protein B0G73_110185 [Paraburkholderia sp. BL25I1N1]
MLDLREGQFKNDTMPLIGIHNIELLVFAQTKDLSPCRGKAIENQRALGIRHGQHDICRAHVLVAKRLGYMTTDVHAVLACNLNREWIRVPANEARVPAELTETAGSARSRMARATGLRQTFPSHTIKTPVISQ